ncbi:MAG: EAL domain-containing protein [Pseudomonadales bacterium]|nr:EAL domain-containing protein [Halioglobus sp.]MCP5129025.1 EAL domain-containing protein [Pseudomonadales bacterium]
MAQAVDQARADGSHLGLILVDLANLAGVNHNYGYETGDELLLTAYGQLLDLSKLPDSVFRMGGHSFSFILSDLGNPAFIALAMNRVYRTLDSALRGGSGVHRVDIRIGIAVNRVGGQEFMTMLANAEASLLQSRLGGQLRIEDVLIDGDEVPAQQRLEQNLEEALLNNEFELHYQPKIEISSGKLHGAEALLRWQSPDGENISPEIIVEWAETTGRSYELTRWVVHRALRQMRQWQGRLDIGVAVNIPAGLAGDPDLPTLLHDALAIWGVAPEMVTAELTERALIEDKQAGYDNLLKLREMGVNVSIDDFGTGYSSLSYFKHIPARELKIDKSFIESMQSDIQNMELVKIIIHIARLFGLTVVAEGIEDSRSLSTLRELGCDYAQGYYFSRP